MLSGELGEDFSFGFPPLQDSFGNAVTDEHQPHQESISKIAVAKDKVHPIKLGGR